MIPFLYSHARGSKSTSPRTSLQRQAIHSPARVSARQAALQNMLANIAVVFALRQDLEHELITVVFGQTSLSCRTRSQDGCHGLWAYRDTYRVSKGFRLVLLGLQGHILENCVNTPTGLPGFEAMHTSGQFNHTGSKPIKLFSDFRLPSSSFFAFWIHLRSSSSTLSRVIMCQHVVWRDSS